MCASSSSQLSRLGPRPPCLVLQVTGRTAQELGTLHDALAAMPVREGEGGRGWGC
jgi:hypothetical protein